MDYKTARDVLAEAASGGYLDQELPEAEGEFIELAEYYASEATKAFEAGMKDDHVIAIMNLSGMKASPPVLSESAEPEEHEGTPPGEFQSDNLGGFAPGITDEDVPPITKDHSFFNEGLPIPNPVEVSLDMPTDLTDLGDKQLRRLYSAFGAYLSRARWLLAISSSNLANANHLKDEAFRIAYINTNRFIKLRDKKATKDLIENEAREDDNYKTWEEKVVKHNQEVIHWRALVDIYSDNVNRLSREWTMRTEEYERSR